MRFLLPITLLALAIGCRNGHSSWRNIPPNEERLEEAAAVLQEEIDLLTRNVKRIREEPGPKPPSASQARNAYSQSQRIRDLRTMLEILERRRSALSSEIRAYGETVYDRF